MQKLSTIAGIPAGTYAGHCEGGIEDQEYGHAEPKNQVTDSDSEKETAVPTHFYLQGNVKLR